MSLILISSSSSDISMMVKFWVVITDPNVVVAPIADTLIIAM